MLFYIVRRPGLDFEGVVALRLAIRSTGWVGYFRQSSRAWVVSASLLVATGDKVILTGCCVKWLETCEPSRSSLCVTRDFEQRERLCEKVLKKHYLIESHMCERRCEESKFLISAFVLVVYVF